MAVSAIQALDAVVPTVEARSLDISNGRYPNSILGIFLADAKVVGGQTNGFVAPVANTGDTSEKERFDVDNPETHGFDNSNMEWPDTFIVPKRFQNPIEGRFDMAGYDGGHILYEHEWQRLTQMGQPFDISASKIADSILNSMYRRINADMLRIVSSTDGGSYGEVTPSWADFGTNPKRVMDIRYPMQTGYAGNSATPDSTVYQYGDNLNLNSIGSVDQTRIKAISVGESAIHFGAPDPTNFNTKIKFPLQDADRGVTMMDRYYVLVDSATWNFISQFVQDFVRIPNGSKFDSFGFTDLGMYMGMTFIRIGELDRLYAVTGERIMIGFSTNPDDWRARQWKMGQITSISNEEFKKQMQVGIQMAWNWDFKFELRNRKPWKSWMAKYVDV